MREKTPVDMMLVRRLCAAGSTAVEILLALRDVGIACSPETLRRRMREANLTTRQIKARGEAERCPTHGVIYPDIDPWPAHVKF